MILLDTSVVLEIIEVGAGYEVCTRHLKRFDPRTVYISAITVFEVEAGLFDHGPHIRRRRAVWKLFYSSTITEFVFDDVAIEAARIIRETAKAGNQVGKLDALIAASAIVSDLTVATRDSDFDRMTGVKVEHWR